MINKDKEYLTVIEVAEIVGVSKQSVYQKLNKSLKEYVKVIENKKYLHKSVLFEVYGIRESQADSQQVEQDIQVDSQLDLQVENTELKTQLEAKDRSIEEKNNRIDELKSEIESLKGQQESQVNSQLDLRIENAELKARLEEKDKLLQEKDDRINELKAEKDKLQSKNDELIETLQQQLENVQIQLDSQTKLNLLAINQTKQIGQDYTVQETGESRDFTDTELDQVQEMPEETKEKNPTASTTAPTQNYKNKRKPKQSKSQSIISNLFRGFRI